jgi:hypothetical protein
VHDVVGEQGEHRLAVAAVEGGVIGQHQFGAAIMETVAVDMHQQDPQARGRAWR